MRVFACFVLLALCFQASAEETRVAAASNFAYTLKKLVTEFETSTDHRVGMSLGSSGKLYAQITNGAPFDIFLSADEAKPIALEQIGLSDQRIVYAHGRLAIWIREPGEGSWQRQLSRIKRAAMANPRLAPYGLAAKQTIQAISLDKEPIWVIAENIGQTYQFVHSGNAGAGFIALSQAIQQQQQGIPGLIELVPGQYHEPISQAGVLLNRGADNPAALAFFEYLQSDAARQLIEADGYQLP